MWTPGGEAEERRLYKGVQESPLEQYLPLGTAVWVNHRRISASPQSSLRVQATIVLRAEEGSGDTIPQEYTNTFSPFQTRAELAVSFVHIVSHIKLSLLTLRVTVSPSPKSAHTYFIIFFSYKNAIRDWMTGIK